MNQYKKLEHIKLNAESNIELEFDYSFKIPFICLIFCAAFFGFLQTIQAAPGDLDTTFNGTGIVTTPVGNDGCCRINSVALQPDGKIVVAGSTVDTRSRFTVYRYLPNGTLDTLFDGDGKVVTQVGGQFANSYAFAVAVQNDGKIVVVGYADSGVSPALVRYNSNGSLDGSFGGGGIAQGSGGFATSVAIQNDGKIVIGGYFFVGNPTNTQNDFLIERFNANGTPDTTFDTDGRVVTPITAIGDDVRSIAIQSDNKIVVAGAANNNLDFALARYNTDGSLDTSFDGDGKVITSIKPVGFEVAESVVIQSDGKIVVAGQSSPNPILVRYNSNGSLDNAFDGDGIIISPLNGSAASVKLQSDGKIVAGGGIGSSIGDFGILRYNTNGSPDTTFGTNGVVTTPIGNGDESISSIAIQSDGKIIALGNYFNGTSWDIALARYLTVLTRVPFDFDGDRKTDISIFRPAVGEWWYLKSSTGGNAALQFGQSTDKLVPGDFTGDGKTDIAFWRPSTGFWFVLRSEDSSFFSFPFGTTGDIPVPSDYDGDGKTDAAVFRPSVATWFILRSSDGGTTISSFGISTDKPVPADYDGDGKADIAIFRPSVGEWWYAKSSTGQTAALQFGSSTDKPVSGDYTGDGKADIAFFRPSTGFWFILRSEDNSFFSFPFGATGDIPVPGDYDGDGKFDTAVFRPSNSTWFLNQTTSGVGIVTFGITGDQPIPSAFVP